MKYCPELIPAFPERWFPNNVFVFRTDATMNLSSGSYNFYPFYLSCFILFPRMNISSIAYCRINEPYQAFFPVWHQICTILKSKGLYKLGLNWFYLVYSLEENVCKKEYSIQATG